MTLRRLLPLIVLALLPAAPALAHPGHGDGTFAAGLLHPLTGLDHILAMLAVGLMAARRGGKAMLGWPAAFVLSMLAGYALGRVAPGISADPAVIASVIVLGAATISSKQAPFGLGLALIAACGLTHGYAHGSEAPGGAGAAFPAGFALSTIALHAAGLGFGVAALNTRKPWMIRAAGAGVVLGGLILAVAAQ